MIKLKHNSTKKTKHVEHLDISFTSIPSDKHPSIKEQRPLTLKDKITSLKEKLRFAARSNNGTESQTSFVVNTSKSLNYMHMLAKNNGSKRVPDSLTNAIEVVAVRRMSTVKIGMKQLSISFMDKWATAALQRGKTGKNP